MRIEDLFMSLVKIDSPSCKEEQIREYVKKYCKKRGINLKVDNYGNLFYTNPKTEYLLMAHMDTVQGDTHIEPVKKEGMIVSRGETILGADDKASLTGILVIVDYFYKRGLEPNFELLFTVEEELGMKGVKEVNLSLFQSKYAISFDKCNETFGSIVMGAPYAVIISIELIGKPAHASLPENAINALKMSGEVINSIPLGGKNNGTTFNLGLIQGGSSANTVPGKIFMHGDIRSHNKKEIQKIIRKVKNVLKEVTKKYSGKYSVDIKRVIKGYKLSRKDKFVNKVGKVLKKLKVEPEYIKTSGGSDINVLNESGIKGLIIASGARYCHTSREQIEIVNLNRIFNTLKYLLVQGSDK